MKPTPHASQWPIRPSVKLCQAFTRCAPTLPTSPYTLRNRESQATLEEIEGFFVHLRLKLLTIPAMA